MESMIDSVRKSVVDSFLVGRGIATVDSDGFYIIMPEHRSGKDEERMTIDQAFFFLRKYIRKSSGKKNI
jgi:hypothetical protein